MKPVLLLLCLCVLGCPRTTPSNDAGAASTAAAGATCTTDEQCASGFSCQTRSDNDPRRRCTAPCTPSTGETEAAACGTGATCLSVAPGGGACTRACVAGDATVACAADEACTGWWFLQPDRQPDAPGCEPFCHADSECPQGTRCNRAGACTTSGATASVADGTPCDPTAANICAGTCLASGAGARLGVCASVVDVQRGQVCPDGNPKVRPNAVPGDSLGLCVFQDCSCADRACPQGLVCVEGAVLLQRVCGYVNADAGVIEAQCSAPDGGP